VLCYPESGNSGARPAHRWGLTPARLGVVWERTLEFRPKTLDSQIAHLASGKPVHGIRATVERALSYNLPLRDFRSHKSASTTDMILDGLNEKGLKCRSVLFPPATPIHPRCQGKARAHPGPAQLGRLAFLGQFATVEERVRAGLRTWMSGLQGDQPAG